MEASTGKIGIITGIRCVEIPDSLNYYVLEDGRKNGEAYSISVEKIDKQTNEILEIYPSIRATASANNIKATNIGAVCAKKPHYLTAGGYKWAYTKEVVVE